MSRPTACEHSRGTVASDTQPIRDYRWWASNGPTAGYLMRLTVDATPARRIATPSASASTSPAPPPLRMPLSVESDVSPSGITYNQVAFHQGGPFAVASVLTAAGSTRAAVSDVTPPAALPAELIRRWRPRLRAKRALVRPRLVADNGRTRPEPSGCRATPHPSEERNHEP